MHTRYSALEQWLKNILETSEFNITPLAGDASFRRYFRAQTSLQSYIIMDAPPDKETLSPFINIGTALAKIGIHTPVIHAYEPVQGFVLLEDLGDKLLLSVLSSHNVDAFYTTAMTILIQMQQCSTHDPQLPAFNEAFILQELSFFRQWFLDKYLDLQLNSTEEQLLKDSFNWLSSNIVKQPQVFVHRDYHSRNLMVIESNKGFDLAVIDFQDAMSGPFTYDLASILKDCYIQWPREMVIQWVTKFYDLLPNNYNWTQPAFIQGFEMCGLQRHLKVLGIFCRLHFRDQKSSYLNDLPLIFNYVMSSLESISTLQPFYQFMQRKVQAPFLARHQ